MLTLFFAVKDAIGGVVASLGLALMAGGALGLLRFSGAYTRIHAASLVSGVGAASVALGLAIMATSPAMAAKLALVLVILAASASTISHVSANSAHAAGIAPISHENSSNSSVRGARS